MEEKIICATKNCVPLMFVVMAFDSEKKNFPLSLILY
jgi:hypothetical protein